MVGWKTSLVLTSILETKEGKRTGERRLHSSERSVCRFYLVNRQIKRLSYR